MAQYVTSLKIAAITCLLKDEVFGKMGRVITQMQSRHEDVLRTADDRSAQRPRMARRTAGVQPKHAELSQFIIGKWIRRAGITPAHVPGIFLKNHAHIFLLDLLVEHGAVEIAKDILHI